MPVCATWRLAKGDPVCWTRQNYKEEMGQKNVRGVAFFCQNFCPGPPPATLGERRLFDQNISQNFPCCTLVFSFVLLQRVFCPGLTLSDCLIQQKYLVGKQEELKEPTPPTQNKHNIYIYKYIYIYCRVKKLVQDLGFYKLKTGPSYKLKTGPSFFCCFPQFYSVFWGIFRNTNSATGCQNSVFAKFGGCQK